MSQRAARPMLKLFAFSRYRFDTTGKATALLDCVGSSAYPPVVFNRAEPIRQKLTPETRASAAALLSGAPRHQAGTLFLGSKAPKVTWMFRWVTGAASQWYAEFDARVITRPHGRADFVQFLLTLFRDFPVIFAGVASDREWNAKHWITEEDEDGGESTTKLGLDLERCLPGVYWMTVFGAELAAHFGRTKLLSSHAGAVDLGKAGVAVVLDGDPVVDERQLGADERRLITSLGKAYFFDIAAPKRACMAIPDVTGS